MHIGYILLIVSVMLFGLVIMIYRSGARTSLGAADASGRGRYAQLTDLQQIRPDALLYFTTTVFPDQWLKWKRFDAGHIISEEHENTRIAAEHITGFLAAYPNGEIFDWENVIDPFPENIHFIADSAPAPLIDFRPEFITPGILSVRWQAMRMRHNRKYYRLFVQNLTAVELRVLRFGCFTTDAGRYIPLTLHGGMYTAEQFGMWFGLRGGATMQPGDSGCDYFASGEAHPCWWVFEVQMADGKILLVGGELHF